MGHGLISENSGLVYVGERPWHGLGVQCQEAPTTQEAIKMANLDWDVELQEIQTAEGKKIENHRAVMRKDISKCLGVVTKQYNPLQNKDAFSFFDPFLENDLAYIETAGCLFDGKRVFILAKLNLEDMEIQKDDKVQKFILLSNAHDGTQAVRVGFTAIRVVCNNTLSMAENTTGSSSLIRINHRKNVIDTMAEIRETMDLVNQRFLATEEQYKRLAQMGCNTADLENYVKQVFSIKSLEKNFEDNTAISKHEIEEERNKLIKRVEEIFELEPVHNRWTMYNSVNYYLNHERGRNLESAYNSIWFTNAKRLDKKALSLAATI